MKKFNFYLKKDWLYVNWKHYIYISISNPKKTMNKLRGIFKSLKCYFKIDKNAWAPYPVLWVSNPAYIHIISSDVGWKDKYDTPRFEYPPYIWIRIFKINLLWYWDLPLHQKGRLTEDYWEQALWYLHYYGNISYGCNEPNLEKAKESWPWIYYKTKRSTWTDEFLIVK